MKQKGQKDHQKEGKEMLVFCKIICRNDKRHGKNLPQSRKIHGEQTDNQKDRNGQKRIFRHFLSV